jgi:hypothetical protein
MHAVEFAGPPSSFYNRKRKNKYVSIFSSSLESTRDSIRRVRTVSAETPASGSTTGLNFHAVHADAAAARAVGAGTFGPSAAAYAASAGLKMPVVTNAPADLRRQTHHSKPSHNPHEPPIEAMLNAPLRHFFTTETCDYRAARDVGGSAPSSRRQAHTETVNPPTSTLSQSATMQTAHWPLAYVTLCAVALHAFGIFACFAFAENCPIVIMVTSGMCPWTSACSSQVV